MRTRSLAPLLAACLLAACSPSVPATPTNGTASSSAAEASSDAAMEINVTGLQPDDFVMSPLTVKGDAPGGWYYEGRFPVTLIDDDGNLLATGGAEARSDWMTAERVPFSVTLTFKTEARRGTLVLKNDNPSGDPAKDKILRIPVVFQR